MKRYTTLFVNGRKDFTVQTIAPDAAETQREKDLINLYPQMAYQTIDGFGGAFTDAAGYVFSLMSPELQEAFLRDYFSGDGLRYTIGRTSIDSCDFSLETYASCDQDGDTELSAFDMTRAQQYVLPLYQRAAETAGRPMRMMLTPWSPPAWMKTNRNRVGGGKLKPEYHDVWAEYICRYILKCRQDGMDVRMLSSQNEPKATQTWDSCLFTGEEEGHFIQHHLHPALVRHGLEDLELLIWDHNKERAFDRACETLSNPEIEKMVSGVAVHWYSGDHFEALDMITRRFPDKKIVFSEACVEYSILPGENQLRNAQMYGHEILGDLNHGLTSFLDWNLLLDEEGGPNHVRNFCDSPMMYNTHTGVLTRNLSYDYIGHFSRFIEPGAVRIGLSRFSSAVEAAAVRNPDGTLCVVVMNAAPEPVSFFLRLGDRVWPIVQEAESISTCVIEDAD
ncbi:MAG: glucosylceramidase [Clostridia bacterium]|nr:glucosylceramidase [Clostridia bacterium]